MKERGIQFPGGNIKVYVKMSSASTFSKSFVGRWRPRVIYRAIKKFYIKFCKVKINVQQTFTHNTPQSKTKSSWQISPPSSPSLEASNLSFHSQQDKTFPHIAHIPLKKPSYSRLSISNEAMTIESHAKEEEIPRSVYEMSKRARTEK